MTPHAKKLIGAVLMLAWLLLYALLVSGVAIRVLPHANWAITLLFYAAAGMLWIVPIGFALPWMYREPKHDR